MTKYECPSRTGVEWRSVNEEFLLLLVLMLVIELEVRHGESVLLGDRCCELSVIGYRENGVQDDGARRQRSDRVKASLTRLREDDRDRRSESGMRVRAWGGTHRRLLWVGTITARFEITVYDLKDFIFSRQKLKHEIGREPLALSCDSLVKGPRLSIYIGLSCDMMWEDE